MVVPPIETLVFDLGGVLIDWDPRHLYRKLFADEAEMERFLSEVCSPDWHVQHDLGVPVEETTARLIASHPELALEIRAYGERFGEMLGGSDGACVTLLTELQQRGLRTYAATNWSNEFWLEACSQFEFLATFSGILVSGEIGVAKPDPAFYRRLIDDFGLDPTSTLYIDDNVANVAVGRRFGFVVHRYRTASALANALSRLGLR